MHGFSDHISRYDEFFSIVASQGIQVLSWDQRGWGRSVTKPSEKGLTGPTSQVIADVAAFIKDKLPSDVPVFVLGHSMGGGEVITLAADEQYKDVVSQVRGWILDAPFIGFTPEEEPGKLLVFAGRLVGKLLPRQQMKHPIQADRISRDPEVVESIKNDALCHDTGTLEGLASLLDRTAALASGTVPLAGHVQSVLLAHGTGDLVCSYPTSMEWFKRQTIEDKTVKSYEGGYHQLHSDWCKKEFIQDVVDWILKRADEKASVESKL